MPQWAREQGGGLRIGFLKAELCADGKAGATGTEKGGALEQLNTVGRRPAGDPDVPGLCAPDPPPLCSELCPLTRPFQHLPHPRDNTQAQG